MKRSQFRHSALRVGNSTVDVEREMEKLKKSIGQTMTEILIHGSVTPVWKRRVTTYSYFVID